MWPFNKSKQEEPVKIGDLVRIIDHPTFVNEAVRHLIGSQAIVQHLPGHDPQWPAIYFLRCQNGEPIRTPREHFIKLKDGDDPFAEPRNLGHDNPNKVVTWDQVAWKPKREVA